MLHDIWEMLEPIDCVMLGVFLLLVALTFTIFAYPGKRPPGNSSH